ncbi:MAG TPA: RNA polymerase sigma factor SigJ [Acidimicrobiales bacterium]|nr:RNA polymerase sigma factor SigJ [Acidimicrobiales bacterium]
MTGPDDVFNSERSRLLGLAYRILGSLVDAEDVVQDVWIRWSGVDQREIDRPAAWLTTVTTRVCLDRLKSASRRRESYVGPWLPEPILTTPGPEEAVEAAETLTLGFLAMLDQLDPTSRVVFLLTDVFGYESAEVSTAVGKSPAACRQIASRARKRLRDARPARPSPGDRAIADRLMAAIASGDTRAAMALMSEDVVLVTDGGPKRHAARRPVIGPRRVTRFLTNVASRISSSVVVEPATVNAAAGFRLSDAAKEQDGAIAIDVTDGVVSAIWVVTNPDKLTHMDTPAPIS